jgi:hypothetical protein
MRSKEFADGLHPHASEIKASSYPRRGLTHAIPFLNVNLEDAIAL